MHLLTLLLIVVLALWCFVLLRACRRQSKLGRARWMANHERKWGASLSYGRVIIHLEGHIRPEVWLFTPHDREVMIKRANDNPEDARTEEVHCG